MSQITEVRTESLYGFEMRSFDNRRALPGERKTYDIKQLWQRSHEIIGLALQGIKQNKIAEILGVCEATVSNTLNSPLGKTKLSGMRKDRDEDYEKLNDDVVLLTEKALKVYNKILDDETGEVSLKLKKDTADTVSLELAGMKSPIRIDKRSIHATATLAEIEDFKKRGLKAAKESGMLVEVAGEGDGNEFEETAE